VGASGAAVETAECAPDPDLAALVQAWPTLPAALKAAIVAILKASVSGRPSLPHPAAANPSEDSGISPGKTPDHPPASE